MLSLAGIISRVWRKSFNISTDKIDVQFEGIRMQRVAINGFGRIGRNVLRAWFENPKEFHFDIVAINDVADVATLATSV